MEQLQIFDKQFDDWKESANNEAVLRSQRYENLKASGLSEEKLDAMSKPIPRNGGHGKA
jgi:hypothetical protein